MDLSNGLALMVSSPGGDGLAAERIVNTCRAYSGTGDYWVIVPGKAKSAATIICMGASKIMMSSSSELGPVDPQILRIEDGRRKVFSAHNIVSSYDKLFNEAVSGTGRLEPYLQQLEHFDDRDITTYRSLIKLSEDISIKILRSGMMKNLNEADVRDKIKVFLIPDAGTLIHGRPIYLEEVSSCGLKTETLDVKDSLWRSVYDLYTRTEWFVSLQVGKAVESEKESFYAQAPDR